MKKLLLLILSLNLTSCQAQFRDIEPREPKIVTAPFTVMYAKADEAVLFSRLASATYKVDPLDLEAEREYYFILQVAPCIDCEGPRPAKILYYGVSRGQADKDIKEALELYSGHTPKIEK